MVIDFVAVRARLAFRAPPFRYESICANSWAFRIEDGRICEIRGECLPPDCARYSVALFLQQNPRFSGRVISHLGLSGRTAFAFALTRGFF